MKSFVTSALFVTAILFSSAAIAVSGNDWRAASSKNRLLEVTRILENIKNKGCTVKRSPEYFVRQLNDVYAESSVRSMELPKALALIATGAGENWDC